MVTAHRDSAVKFVLPTAKTLAGTGINEVERNALKILARHRKGFEGFLKTVLPAQIGERCRVERLHAERQTVDSGTGKSCKFGSLGACRVGLSGHLNAVGHIPIAADRLEHGVEGFRRHQRRRTTTEENTRYGSPREVGREAVDFTHKCAGPPRLIDTVSNMAVKVAIGTFGQAKRPMDVNAKRPIRVKNRHRPAERRQPNDGSCRVFAAAPFPRR